MKPETFRKLAAAGLSHEQMALVLEIIDEQERAHIEADEARKSVARDRVNRWRESKKPDVTLQKVTETQRNGSHERDARGDVKQINLEIPNSKKENTADKPLSDLAGFKAALQPILSQERIDAVVDHRRKKKAGISAHTGRLLANALKACPDANAAADEMVLRNWTSVKPQWLEAKNSSRPTGPPGRESEFARHQRECTEALERSVYGDRPNDKPSSNSAAFDLEPGDWRTH